MRNRPGLSGWATLLTAAAVAEGCIAEREPSRSVLTRGRMEAGTAVQAGSDGGWSADPEGGYEGEAERAGEVRRARYCMGTIASVRIGTPGETEREDGEAQAGIAARQRPEPGGGTALGALAEGALDRIDEVDRAASLYKPGSDLVRLNKDGFPGPVGVGPVLGELLAESLRIARLTGGAFDPSVKPVLDELGFYREIGSVPDPQGMEGALARVGWRSVRQDERGGAVSFGRPGMALDFGGIGKGYALDRAAAFLRSRGVRSAALEIGRSSTIFIGPNLSAPDGLHRLDVSVPDGREGETVEAVVAVPEGSIATSSPRSQVRRGAAGRTVGHIVDPRRGPLLSPVLSATVWAPAAAEADALATALVVAGPAGLRRFARKTRFEALLLVSAENGEVKAVATSGLAWSRPAR